MASTFNNPSFPISPALCGVGASCSIWDEGRTFEDEERCLNRHPVSSVPVGGVYEKASHVLFKVGSSFVLDQGLMERGCDCGSFRAAMCSGMKVNLPPPQETRSIPAHSECQVQVNVLYMHTDRSCHQKTLVHYIIGQLWDYLQSSWSCFKALIDQSAWVLVMCQHHRELCFSQSLIKAEAPSGVFSKRAVADTLFKSLAARSHGSLLAERELSGDVDQLLLWNMNSVYKVFNCCIRLNCNALKEVSFIPVNKDL